MTLLPRIFLLHRANKLLMHRAPRLNADIIWLRVTDKRSLKLYSGLDLLPIDHFLANVKGRQRLCNIEVNGCVCHNATGTDSATESERDSMRIRLGIVTQVAFRLECHRVVEDVWVVCEAPVVNSMLDTGDGQMGQVRRTRY